jgi:hypothetical protein
MAETLSGEPARQASRAGPLCGAPPAGKENCGLSGRARYALTLVTIRRLGTYEGRGISPESRRN